MMWSVREKLIVLSSAAWLTGLACGKETARPGKAHNAEAELPLPCAVSAIFESRCQSCHSATPSAGAPMSLVSWDDLQRPAASHAGRKVWQLVGERIHDRKRPMPPLDWPALTPEEVEAMDRWVAAGAPAGTEMCAAGMPAPGVNVPPVLPCQATEIYAAHAPLAADLGFAVPGKRQNGGDVTVCFSFVRSEGAAAQAVAWGPVLSDPRVVHHMSLFATSDPVQDGAIGPCRLQNATYLMGWEPGRSHTILPEDVGLELPSRGSRGMILEVHYHNAQDHKIVDSSGMAICGADQPRPLTAGIVTLGTEDILVEALQPGEAVGLCPSSVTGRFTGPLRVLATAPHMHDTGVSIETRVVRPDGSELVLAPARPWDSHRQPLFEHNPPAEVQPGDTLVTTCRYSNDKPHPVGFGPRVIDEMCYSYNLVYPLSALPAALEQAPLRLCDCPTGESCGF
jgi:hypothetical protein